MPLYHYEAHDPAGKKVIGSMQVTDEGVLARRLQAMGYVPVLVQPALARPAAPGVATGGVTRVPKRAVAQFYYELWMSWKAGIPAFHALDEIAARTAHSGMRRIAAAMAQSAQQGGGLADQMARFPMIFSPAEIGLVRAGELGGFVVEALKELQTQIETDLETRRRCTFPAVYFSILALVAVWFAIPAITILRPAAAALDARAGVPAVLRTLLYFSLPATLAGFGGMAALNWLTRRPGWRRRWHACLLKLPGFGAMAVNRSRAIFAAALRLLYHGGVNPYDSWCAASESVPNLVLSEQLAAQRESVRIGGKFSDALRNSGVYPLSDVGLLATGERTGNIEEVLGRIADTHNQEAGSVIARLPLLVRVTFSVLGIALVGFVMILGYHTYFSSILDAASKWAE
jgi:type II secretory pathway component PulF